MYEQEGFLSVWVGKFKSRQILANYTAFIWEGDEDAWSPFSEDSGVFWFDHDLQEAIVFDRPLLQEPEMLDRFSWSESYAPAVIAALEAGGYHDINTIFILFDTAYDPQKADPLPEAKLVFLGVFPLSRGQN